MLKGIPCPHAIDSLHHRKLDPTNYISHWYNRETYMKTYNHFIQPVSNMKMWLESQNISVLPPHVRKLPGRPSKVKRKEQGETKKSAKLSKRWIEMSCSNCHNKGHNKRKCLFGASASASSSHVTAGTGPRASHAAADGPRASPAAVAGPRPSPAPADGPRPSPAPDVGPRASLAAADGPRASPAPIAAAGPRPSPAPADGPRTSPAAANGPRPSHAPAVGPRASPAAGSGPRPSPAPVVGPRKSPVVASGLRLSPPAASGLRPSPPAASTGPRSIPVLGARSKPAASTGRGRGRPKGSTEKGCAASRRRIIGMGLLHAQSGATIINPRMSSERFTNVKSSAFVTGDLGYRLTSDVKWKGKQAMTSSQLQEMRETKQIVTRSKVAHLSQESSNAQPDNI